MSLVLNSGEYLSGSGISTSISTEFTVACYFKAENTTGWKAAVNAYKSGESSTTNIVLSANGSTYDHWFHPNAQIRLDGAGTVSTSAWQLILINYKQSTPQAKSYLGATNTNTLSTDSGSFLVSPDSIEIGRAVYTTISPAYVDGKISHVSIWNKQLTPTEVTDLATGGAGGIGKNPQAVANANLVFYAALTSDATVTVGGISLSATGSVSYDADNPSVESYSTSTNVTMANVTQANTVTAAAIYSSDTGTLTTAPLKNNAGTLLANETGATAYIHNMTTGTLVVAKTGQTTNSSGVMVVSDPLILPATQYRIVIKLASAAEGLDKLTAT